MRSSYSGRGFGNNNFEGMWQALEELRSGFEKRSGTRAGRGEVRTAVLILLAESPMHGYQIIREIEERSGGSWKPSAGSVYPTLQLLADEGLVDTEESSGRKIYSLTEAGREAAKDVEDSVPWESIETESGNGFATLAKSGFELAQAAAHVRRTGNTEQVKEAAEVLDEARRKLYSILAQN